MGVRESPEPSAPPCHVQEVTIVIIEDRRGVLSWLLNIFWIFNGGLQTAALWLLVGFLCCITVIGIPYGFLCFRISGFVMLPFGQRIVYRPFSTYSTVANIVWLPIGFLLSAWHLIWALISFITIIGIPFSFQHIKLAQFSLWPFGAEISPYTAASYTASTLCTPFIV